MAFKSRVLSHSSVGTKIAEAANPIKKKKMLQCCSRAMKVLGNCLWLPFLLPNRTGKDGGILESCSLLRVHTRHRLYICRCRILNWYYRGWVAGLTPFPGTQWFPSTTASLSCQYTWSLEQESELCIAMYAFKENLFNLCFIMLRISKIPLTCFVLRPFWHLMCKRWMKII